MVLNEGTAKADEETEIVSRQKNLIRRSRVTAAIRIANRYFLHRSVTHSQEYNTVYWGFKENIGAGKEVFRFY